MKEQAKMRRANLLLLLTATIWGTAFVAQSAGMDHIGPFTFICIRYWIGGITLLPCIAFLDRRSGGNRVRGDRKTLLLGGLSCGLVLFFATTFQQIGIMGTTVGKAGFITSLYILIMPLLGIFLGRRVGLRIWGCVALALVGMYLLCLSGAVTGLSHGDAMVLVCSVLYSVHIMVIDHFSPKVDGVRMSCIQFLVVGVISIAPMILEHPALHDILAASGSILYAGVMSSSVAYTLQIVAQKDTDPTIATLIMSLESVISMLAGWLLLNQAMTGRELFGAALVFCAIIIAQLPQRTKA